MLELTNFGHLTTSTIQFESRDKNWLMTPLAEIMTLYFLFQNTFILRKPIVAIFADIIKIAIIFIKEIFNDSK